jgi:Zn-dependent protease with chaperone function
MDFFQRQDQARRKTKWLILYFSLAVISMIVMIYGVALLVNGYVGLHHSHYVINDYDGSPQFSLWNPKLFFEVALGTVAVILCGTTYKTMALAGGGGAVAESLGGRLVASNTADPDERRLLNVVEEMAIASGVPMPQVYVLDDEKGINAFAAGHTTSDAVVAVTHGCVKLLSRDELQGVIGHEFSHILNGDMKLNVRLIGILFGIFCIATIGRILLSMRGSSSRDRNPLPLVGILLLVIGSMGLFFGRLIQAAVSRQREFLADASSVQFTRNPAGLSGALQKIGGYGFGSWLISDHAPDAGHLFFGNGIPRPLFGLMATHPPLEDRIRAIDTAWDGKFPRVDMTEIREEIQKDAKNPHPVFVDGRMIILGGVMAEAAKPAPPPVIRPHAVMPNLGKPTPMHLEYAQQLRDALPESLTNSAREPLAAAAMIYALVLAPDDAMRTTQLDGIAKHFSQEVADKTAALYPDVSAVAARVRLPIVNLALGALKQLTPQQFSQFSPTLQWLINSDGQVALFEFVLQKIVMRNLGAKFGGAPRPTVQFYTLRPLVPDCVVVLSALAQVGSEDAAEVRKAFDTGVPYLRAPDSVAIDLLPVDQCGVGALGESLDRLGQSVPIIKKNVLEACAHVIGADGVIHEEEAELLRAVADTLDCPMPPLQASA